MIRHRWMIFLLFVSALISAGTVVGQESQYKIVGRALKETALQELTMDAAQALLADILHDLELLRTEEGQEALVLTVDSMREVAASLVKGLSTQQGLAEANAAIEEKTRRQTDARREAAKALAQDLEVKNGELDSGVLPEAKRRLEKARDDLTLWSSGESQGHRERHQGLAQSIVEAAESMAEAADARGSAQAALDKARATNVTQDVQRPLLEAARLASLRVVWETFLRNKITSDIWKDNLTAALNQSMGEEQLLKVNLEIAARLVRHLEEQAARSEQQAKERADTQRSWWEARLQELPESRAAERPFIELRLLEFELVAELAEIKGRRSTWNARFGVGGKLAETRSEAHELHERIQRSAGGDAFDELPDEASELRELVGEAEERQKRLSQAMDEMEANRDELRSRLRVSRAAVREIRARIADAMAEARAAEGGIPAGSQGAWDRLEDQLPQYCNDRLAAWQGLGDDLKNQTVRLDEARSWIAEDLGILRSRLLWTRRGSHISLAAFEQVLDDVSDLADGFGGDTADWMGVIQSHVSNRDNRFRVILGGILLVLSLVLFRVIHRRLTGTYEWIEGRTDHSASRVLLTVLRRTDVAFMVALAFVGAPIAAGFPWSVTAPMAILFLSPFLYRFGRVLVDVLFAPGDDSGRIVKLDEPVTQLLHRAGVQPLNLAVCFVPLGMLMDVGGYREINPGFVEAWWLVFKVLLHALLIVTLFRPALIGAVIRGEGVLAVWMKTWLLLAWPIVVGTVIGLFVLDSLRYAEAAAFFRILAVKILFVATLSYVLYRFLLRRSVPSREFFDVDQEDYAEESEWFAEGRRRLINRIIRIGLRLLVFVPTVFLMGRLAPSMGGGSFANIASSLTGGIATNNIVLAIIVLWCAVLVRRYWQDLMRFFFLPGSRLDAGLHYTFTTLASYGIVGAGVFLSLRILRVDSDQIAWVMSALVLGIGFGLQSIFRNFVSGIILLVERPVKVGDNVTVGGCGGQVEKITMRATTVMSWDGTGIVIPNEELIGGSVTNHSLGHPRLRTNISVGVAYGSDVGEVRRLILEAAEKHGLTLKRPGSDVFFVGFGDSSLDFELRYWTATGTHRLRVASDIRFAIDAAFRRHGIEIPFPQQDVTVRGVDGDVVLGFGGEPVEREAEVTEGYDPGAAGSDAASRGEADDD